MEPAAAQNNTPASTPAGRNLARFHDLACQLITAAEKKDKRDILRIYDEMNECDLEAVPTEEFTAYDKLVSEANDILFS